MTFSASTVALSIAPRIPEGTPEGVALSTPEGVGLVAVLGLLAVGFYALLASRNLIKLVIGLQLLVKGAVLALVLAGTANGQLQVAQSLAVTVIVADTIVAVIGMALAVQVRRRTGSMDVKRLSTLRG
jgi:NADH:ubiquinone oxidoreductase subunit K